MMHLVRIGTKLVLLPESELWRATVDYGELPEDNTLGFPEPVEWYQDVAQWLHGRGL